MTDDQTRAMPTPAAAERVTAAAVPAAEPAAAAAVPAAQPAATSATHAASTETVAPAAAVPAAVTAPVTAVRSDSNRARWVVGLGVAGVAIAGLIGAMLLLASPTTPEALRYIPNDAAAVIEMRLDLPGDQLENVGDFLANFPGFADQSTLRDKIDEALSRLVGMAGVGDYRADIKPWLNGPLFVGVTVPAGGTATEGADKFIASATTNGTVNCEAVFKGQTVTREAYRNLDLVLAADGAMACVIDGRQALLGDPATVRKGLDAKAAGSGMDKDARYGAARTAVPGDRLATMFFNGSALQSFMDTTPGDLAVPGIGALAGAVPEWMIVGVRAENDALVVDTAAAPAAASSAAPSMLTNPPAHASVLAPMVPAGTVAYVEYQGANVALQNLLTQLRQVPDLAAPLGMLDGLGGPGALVGWIDDVGIAVSVTGTSPNVAVMLVATDAATATRTVASIGTLLGLGALGGGVEVSTSTIGGVEVTKVTITDLGAVVPPGSVPGLEELPLDGPISFSIAAKGRVVLVTIGDEAMPAILTAAPGGGLVDQAAYKQAAARGLANSRSTIYLGVGSGLDLVKPFVPAEELAKFESDIAPYLDPISSILVTASDDGTTNRSRIVITVTKP